MSRRFKCQTSKKLWPTLDATVANHSRRLRSLLAMSEAALSVRAKFKRRTAKSSLNLNHQLPTSSCTVK